jgi:hypothetical protein
LAEDGCVPERFLLQETPSRRYAQRTEWNVRDSDATVAFTICEQMIGGTALTVRLAEQLGKPVLHLSRKVLAAAGIDPARDAAARLLRFLNEHGVSRLNVAGPRASQEPEVAGFVHEVLVQAFQARCR